MSDEAADPVPPGHGEPGNVGATPPPMMACTKCGGAGVSDGLRCPTCDGSGVVPKEERKTWYFTFGFSHPNAGRFFVVEDATNAEARQLMFDTFGREWAFQYDDAGWHRDGVSQEDRHGLTRLVLNPEEGEAA